MSSKYDNQFGSSSDVDWKAEAKVERERAEKAELSDAINVRLLQEAHRLQNIIASERDRAYQERDDRTKGHG